jgi:hypothetical protein
MRSLASCRPGLRRRRRWLDVEILEDRTPVSETLGAALSLAGLAGVAAGARTFQTAPPPSS